jgi:hypothetical protein
MSELKKREEIDDKSKWKVDKIYTYKKSAKRNQEHFKLLTERRVY